MNIGEPLSFGHYKPNIVHAPYWVEDSNELIWLKCGSGGYFVSKHAVAFMKACVCGVEDLYKDSAMDLFLNAEDIGWNKALRNKRDRDLYNNTKGFLSAFTDEELSVLMPIEYDCSHGRKSTLVRIPTVDEMSGSDMPLFKKRGMRKCQPYKYGPYVSYWLIDSRGSLSTVMYDSGNMRNVIPSCIPDISRGVRAIIRLDDQTPVLCNDDGVFSLAAGRTAFCGDGVAHEETTATHNIELLI